jgi:hypothetical protein
MWFGMAVFSEKHKGTSMHKFTVPMNLLCVKLILVKRSVPVRLLRVESPFDKTWHKIVSRHFTYTNPDYIGGNTVFDNYVKLVLACYVTTRRIRPWFFFANIIFKIRTIESWKQIGTQTLIETRRKILPVATNHRAKINNAIHVILRPSTMSAVGVSAAFRL